MRLWARPSGALRTLLLACCCAGALCACAAAAPEGFVPPSGGRMLAGVPFHPQEDHQCGPSSLATVLNFLGDPASPEAIAAAIYRPGLRGTVSLDLALYPRTRGFSTRFFRGSAADVAAEIDAGRPLLVMIDYGFSGVHYFHYMVVTGYDAEGVRVNSGRDRDMRVSWGRFLSQWSGADDWALSVTRRAAAPKKAETR